jgi:hypothetical protein
VTTALRARFLLDPDVCYLTHGASGAAPIAVFEADQAWQGTSDPAAYLSVRRWRSTASISSRAGPGTSPWPERRGN